LSLTSLFQAQIGAAMAAALLLALLLLALRPGDRASVRNSLILLGLCAIAQIVDTLARSMGVRAAAAVAADVASVLVGLVLARLGVIFVFRVVLEALRARPARIVEDLVTAALFAGWGFVWLRLAGVELASLVTTSAIITGVIAFSMQETLGNVLGGVVLQLDRSIRAGDWVRVDDVSGRIVEITWRHTAIETRNGETVVVPNGWMMKNRFTVIGTRADPDGPWRRWIRLNVDLDAAPGDVCRVLEDAVRNATIENVAPAPPPSAVLMEFGPRHGSYALRYWLIDRGPDDATDSRVRAHLVAALARNGMKLGVPYQEQLDLHDNEAHRHAQAALEQSRRLSALAAVDLFAPLSDAERAELAPHLVYAPFVAGDVITRQGAIAHWLYLIVSGTADVWYETPDGRRAVNMLGPGQVFGEMGMMTGEPRRATVTARTDVACYRLDKSGFAAIIRNRPDIAESISRILFAREAELDGRRQSAASEARGAPHRDMLERIRAFFGIDARSTTN
jgi:small-conductance mechanosensitive channel/CRP-like cAMP-binding protein